jgi:phage tail sheath protein FI
MPEYLTPGVYFEWMDASTKAISPLRTDIAAFLGIAERGPLDMPTRIISWQQFQSVFGNFIPNGYLAYTVKAFFENGGRECHVVRVAAPAAKAVTAGTQPSSAESTVNLTDGFSPGAVVTARQVRQTFTTGATQPADLASSIVDDISGFPQGALVKISQASQLAYRRVRAADSTFAGPVLYWRTPLNPDFDLTNTIFFETKHQHDLMVSSVQGSTLVWETPLPEFFDLKLPIEFETGAGIASGELLGQDSMPTLTIEALSAGAWGNNLWVRVSQSNSAATRTAGVTQPLDGLSSIVESVSGFLIGSLVRVYQDATPQPLVSYRVIKAVDPARNLIGWDAALDPAYDLVAANNQSRPLSFETLEFNLSLYSGGQLRETFSGLSLIPDPERTRPSNLEIAEAERRDSRKAHAERVVNSASNLIRIHDRRWPHAAVDYFASVPNPNAENLRQGKLALVAGRDGIAALKPRDFTGNLASLQKRGLRTLEDTNEVAIVAVPDALIRPLPPRMKQRPPAALPPDPCLPCQAKPPGAGPPAPVWIERAPEFSPEEIEGVQQALIAHCESQHDRIGLLDPPIRSTSGQTSDGDVVQSWRRRFDSQYGALYFPWVLVYDPLKLNGNLVRAVPPSGHVAGIYARTDLELGVHRAPANAEVRWAQAASEEVAAELQGALNPAGINCLRTLAGRGLRVYGARTVSSDSLWRFVNVRRLMMMIEEAIETSLQWSVFEPHDLELRHALITGISGFLDLMWQQGALNGATADEAFFVKCDAENNPGDQLSLGRLVVDVGVAPVRPAEFVVLRVGKTAESLEITEMRGITGGSLIV